jgi:Cd2+/Zn2+-exporting ATPase
MTLHDQQTSPDVKKTDDAVGQSACCGEHCGSVAMPMPVARVEKTLSDVGVQTAIRIQQMDCPTEEGLLRKKLGGMPGVTGLEFNLMQRVLTVTHATSTVGPILDAIRSLGFAPEVVDGASAHDEPAAEPNKPWWPLALAGVAAVASEGVEWANLPTWTAAVLALTAVLACGLTTYKKGWIAIRNGNLNINALMSIAVTGALLLGQWPEAAMVMVLFTIAELIEAKSLDRARNAIQGLMQLAPERATVLQADGTWGDVDAKAVAIDARVRIKPGERIALDGRIVSGKSTINQPPSPAKACRWTRSEGDAVFAGTINESGSFEYLVTAAAGNSTLARIIHAVEEAQGARPHTALCGPVCKGLYASGLCHCVGRGHPAAVAAGRGWFDWVYKALVLLVIACPCALVISTPVTIVSGLAAAARLGILIKGGVYLEEGRKLKWLALDKTGTITHGKPVQTDFTVLNGGDAARVRSLAASLASRSDHPVSRAVAQAAQADGVALREVQDFEALAGRGTKGRIEGTLYYLGNHRLIHEQGRCSDALEAQLSAWRCREKP